MKPELKVMVDALHAQSCRDDSLSLMVRETFLAALHWKGEELWCGPWNVGYSYTRPNREVWRYGFWAGGEPFESPTRDEARAALMTAARGQINQWFKEQSE
jgi:hypothetical protein